MTDTVDPSAARRLDGNAAAGTLSELFAVDLTAAWSRCASCGTTSMLGAHHLYGDAPAVVLRCPTCSDVVLRFAARADRMLLDLRGAQLLVVPVPAPAEREGRRPSTTSTGQTTDVRRGRPAEAGGAPEPG